ncbi:MAG TPA: hypothetical protein VIJ33_00410 [Solirubrobacteraceae bacterium]
MALIALKLFLTPSLIGAVTLAQRRWGPTIGGLLVGLPLTSGPVALFFAIEHGTKFATAAAAATILGTAGATVFCLAYARAAVTRPWPLATIMGAAAYIPAVTMLRLIPDDFPVLSYVAICVLLLIARAAIQAPPSRQTTLECRAPRWDLPARMLLATALVVGLTAAAGMLGARLSGLLSPIPVYATVLAVFTHRVEGGRAAQRLLRGVLTGNFAFITFFLVLTLALHHDGTSAAFLLASLSVVVIQSIALIVAGRERLSGSSCHVAVEVRR